MSARPLSIRVIALFLLAATGVAHADVDEQSELDKARNAYLAHQYDEADNRLRMLLDAKSPVLHDRVLVNQAHMYWGAVLIAKKRPAEANEQFEELLLNDPNYEPDPLSFPTDVVNNFIDARAHLRRRLEEMAVVRAKQEAERRKRDEAERKGQLQRLKLLERLAGEEKTVERHSRWMALVPFGVGQFQNDQKALGWTFLGTEAVLLAASAITVPIYLNYLQARSDAFARGDNFSAQEQIDRAQTVRTVNLSLDLTFLGVVALGIIQAQAAFVPEVAQLNKRPIPDIGPPPGGVSFELVPILSAREGGSATIGGGIGLRGRF